MTIVFAFRWDKIDLDVCACVRVCDGYLKVFQLKPTRFNWWFINSPNAPFDFCCKQVLKWNHLHWSYFHHFLTILWCILYSECNHRIDIRCIIRSLNICWPKIGNERFQNRWIWSTHQKYRIRLIDCTYQIYNCSEKFYYYQSVLLLLTVGFVVSILLCCDLIVFVTFNVSEQYYYYYEFFISLFALYSTRSLAQHSRGLHCLFPSLSL